MNMAKLEEIVLGLKNEDGNCNKLRCANDTTLLAESKDSDDLGIREVRMENAKSRFTSNIKKIKATSTNIVSEFTDVSKNSESDR